MSTAADTLLGQLDGLNAQELKRLLVEHLTRQKLGLYWESNAIERDAALNANLVLPRLVPQWSCTPESLVGMGVSGLKATLQTPAVELGGGGG